jgi:histidyl-tRNA synthetase
LEVLQNLKLGDVELKLSHSGLIRAMLSGLGLNHEEQTSLFDRILDGDIDALTKVKPKKAAVSKTISALLDLTGKSGGLLKNLKSLYAKELPELTAPLDDFINIIDLLESLGIKYQIDLDSGQGFEYYTGFVFHLSINGEHVGGGGRYDALIPLMSGKKVAASGFALYLDRLINMIAPALTPTAELPGILIKVIHNDGEAVKAGFNLADLIHRNGGKAEMDIGGKPPAGFNWIADVTKSPLFILTNRTNRRKYEVNNIAKVLKILQNEKTNKNRFTKRTSSR